MSYSLIGLGLIIVGWLIQFLVMNKKKKGVNQVFVMVYALGVLVLAWDLSSSEETKLLGAANLLSLTTALMVLTKARLMEKK
ncbi:MAG: hypothetical protein ACD_51C00224G0003 [uncultured bacterium]|nr:MAG: hypothetical protein ACD_51C00224G0003 [uncultured bacterium]OGJ48648.1 MAG: hypothetical protein A2344_05105 [Candidatus Peregrinibacteria bacterium RIFOXYB12_FULL_41_12]OGJ48739.1 MAG: hypothetical protein A2244_03530 [Candidatus Peregrinibacteria bacterium RIFOXYA2_FULL_41_18]OGJ52813.1 MAG: hypothetical protein A2448_01270 [Candidatus Peregrinibacteria bacterium RIFOXYC2_FULL_41_22]OGJ52963.1 MAG: hypothetical protein A2336_05610 [Candidatus Peregrinibacteria bacterium RIFOXYB2_FULL